MKILTSMAELHTALCEGKIIQRHEINTWEDVRDLNDYHYGTVKNLIDGGYFRVKPITLEFLVSNYLAQDNSIRTKHFKADREQNLKDFYAYNVKYSVKWANLTDRATGTVVHRFYRNKHNAVVSDCTCNTCGGTKKGNKDETD